MPLRRVLVVVVVVIVVLLVLCAETAVRERYVSPPSPTPPMTDLAKLLPPTRDVYPPDSVDVVTLFWTGGLYATYRLCELIVVQRRRVRPVYVVATGLDGRVTTLHELRAIAAVRRALARLPGSADMLLDIWIFTPTVVHDEVRRQLDASLGATASRLFGGMAQAAYAIAPRRPIEWTLIYHTGQQRLRGHVLGLLPYDDAVCGYRGSASPNAAFASLFRHVLFVVLDGAKAGKRGCAQAPTFQYAQEHGFAAALRPTWSCVQPVRRDRDSRRTVACRRCTPCVVRRGWFPRKKAGKR